MGNIEIVNKIPKDLRDEAANVDEIVIIVPDHGYKRARRNALEQLLRILELCDA